MRLKTKAAVNYNVDSEKYGLSSNVTLYRLPEIPGYRKSEYVGIYTSFLGIFWGLFSFIKFKKGDKICRYEGVRFNWKYKCNRESDYIWTNEDHSICIDAQCFNSCYGRFANDSLNYKTHNAVIKQDMNDGLVYLYATDDIMPFCEIFVRYGKSYWEEKDDFKNKLSDYDSD